MKFFKIIFIKKLNLKKYFNLKLLKISLIISKVTYLRKC